MKSLFFLLLVIGLISAQCPVIPYLVPNTGYAVGSVNQYFTNGNQDSVHSYTTLFRHRIISNQVHEDITVLGSGCSSDVYTRYYDAWANGTYDLYLDINGGGFNLVGGGRCFGGTNAVNCPTYIGQSVVSGITATEWKEYKCDGGVKSTIAVSADDNPTGLVVGDWYAVPSGIWTGLDTDLTAAMERPMRICHNCPRRGLPSLLASLKAEREI